MKSCYTLLAVILAWVLMPPVQAGKLFRWVDESGQVHYGDKIPPRYADQEVHQLNDHGVTVKIKERAKTPEEKAADARRRALEAKKAKKRARQATYDRMLMETFPSEHAITAAYREKKEAIQARIIANRGNQQNFREHLNKLHKRAADYELAGRPVPKVLQDEIRDTKRNIAASQELIDKYKSEIDVIDKKAAKDIKRYRELKHPQGNS